MADFGKKFLRIAFTPPVGCACFRIDENQINVGGNVQFITAGFAHRDHAQVLRGAGVAPQRCAVQPLIIRVGKIQCGLDGKVGKQGNGARDFVQIADAVDVAHDDVADHITAQQTQLPRQFGLVFVVAEGVPIGKGLEIFHGQRFFKHRQKAVGLQVAVVEVAGKVKGVAAGGIEHGHGKRSG